MSKEPFCWFMEAPDGSNSAGPFDTKEQGEAWAKMSAVHAPHYADWKAIPLYRAALSSEGESGKVAGTLEDAIAWCEAQADRIKGDLHQRPSDFRFIADLLRQKATSERESGEYVRVPKEPTSEMIEAGREAYLAAAMGSSDDFLAKHPYHTESTRYRAMIAAAPSQVSGKCYECDTPLPADRICSTCNPAAPSQAGGEPVAIDAEDASFGKCLTCGRSLAAPSQESGNA